MSAVPNIDKEAMASVLSFSHTLVTEKSAGLGLLDFPIENLPHVSAEPSADHHQVVSVQTVPVPMRPDVSGGHHCHCRERVAVGASMVDDGVDTTGYVGSAHLLISHGSGAGGVCLGGARRCGQTALVPQMARVLGYKTKTIKMYADMTARDLLQ